jgi:DNA-binding LytR/AlgR family response regulator
MIRIALCDDEQEILDSLSHFIREYSGKAGGEALETVAYHSADALLYAIEDSCHFDIFILDVYIGDKMGTHLARAIRNRGIESPIIFATTSVEHAPESYETGTLRYLIKPINPAKFYESMDAALASVEKISQRLIKIKTENGLESINVSHIICSEAHDHYQYVTMYHGTQIKIRMTVTELFTMLSGYGGFIRIGSAYIINLRHVKNVSRTEVCLYNDVSIQIPRGKHAEIKNAFWNFQYEGQE